MKHAASLVAAKHIATQAPRNMDDERWLIRDVTPTDGGGDLTDGVIGDGHHHDIDVFDDEIPPRRKRAYRHVGAAQR